MPIVTNPVSDRSDIYLGQTGVVLQMSFLGFNGELVDLTVLPKVRVMTPSGDVYFEAEAVKTPSTTGLYTVTFDMAAGVQTGRWRDRWIVDPADYALFDSTFMEWNPEPAASMYSTTERRPILENTFVVFPQSLTNAAIAAESSKIDWSKDGVSISRANVERMRNARADILNDDIGFPAVVRTARS